MQYGADELLASVTSSKYTKGSCRTTYSPTLVKGQVMPLMPSWYAFHDTPAVFSSVTRWLAVLW